MQETSTRYMQASYGKPQYKESAFVMITCEDEQDIKVIETLTSISEVKEVQHTWGNYSIIIKIETDTVQSLRDVIETKIRKIEKVRTTTTLISSPILVS